MPSTIVSIDFKVLTEHALGLGAAYAWRFWVLGIPVLKFQEQVVEWTEGKSVSYQATSGWKMSFRTELTPATEDTALKTEITFSLFGIGLLDELFGPIVRWRLGRVYKRLEERLEPVVA